MSFEVVGMALYGFITTNTGQCQPHNTPLRVLVTVNPQYILHCLLSIRDRTQGMYDQTVSIYDNSAGTYLGLWDKYSSLLMQAWRESSRQYHSFVKKRWIP